MKFIILISIAISSLSLLASPTTDRKLNITSFVYLQTGGQTNNYGAELCGNVSGKGHALDRITVVADYQTKSPGSYNSLLDENGNFCVVVRTVTGEASAKFWQFGSSSQSGSQQEPVVVTIK